MSNRVAQPATTNTVEERQLDGRSVGAAAHQVIGELLAAGLREPTFEELLAAVGRSQLVREGVASFRQAARQRLITATGVYVRLFVPGREWEFVGREVEVSEARFDLVFRDSDGRVRADEIKAGRLCAEDTRKLEDQLGRQLDGGRARWEESFVGVRALLLWAPVRSFLARPDGEREQLLDVGGGDLDG